MYRELKNCLACNCDDLVDFLDIGNQPLANSYPKEHGVEEKFPLVVRRCNSCSHYQLSVAVDPKTMFKDYMYLSGISEQNKRYFKDFANSCVGNSILDIGSNDCSLLDCFDGWERYAVEPATNLVKFYENKSITLISDFFPTKIDRKFDVITAFNVFAHNSNPFFFLSKCKELLNDDGKLYIQTSQKDMVENGEFDTVYHEHISYFTIQSMQKLTERVGLILDEVKIVDFLGKSYLFTFKSKKTDDSMDKKIQETYVNLLKEIGNPLVVYSVPAKGVVLLNLYKITPEYAVEDNPLKQGRYIPGIDCKIHETDKLFDDDRDLTILILAWNMYEEIKNKIQSKRGTRDTLIRVFPKFLVESYATV